MDNALILQITRTLETKCPSVLARPRVLSAAFALAFSRALTLPAAPVESIHTYFNINHRGDFNQLASALNEQLLFDVPSALSLSLTFYSLRYNVLFPAPTQLGQICYGFFDTLMGVEQFVSPEVHEFTNTHKLAINDVANQLRECIDACVTAK